MLINMQVRFDSTNKLIPQVAAEVIKAFMETES
jgi:hypothetical protein